MPVPKTGMLFYPLPKMDKGNERVLSDFLERVKGIALKDAPVDMARVMKLTKEYIENNWTPAARYRLVVIVSLIAQIRKQKLREPPLEVFSRISDYFYSENQIEELLENNFFQEYLQENLICGYEVKRKLGQGAYGSVSMVAFDGSVRALKIIDTEPRHGLFPLIEIDITTRLRNHYLVHSDKLVLSEEKTCEIKGYGLLLPLGLADVHSLTSSLDFADKILVLYDSLLGLRCLQEHNILHGDLKPQNFIVFREEEKKEPKTLEGAMSKIQIKLAPYHPYEYRISDFGISKYLDPQTHSYPETGDLYTLTYRPPEGFGKKPHIFTFASDVWSLGASFFDILTGHWIMFDRREHLDLETTIKARMERYLGGADQGPYWVYIRDKVAPTVDPAFSKNVQDILEKMLHLDPTKRSTVGELLAHPLFEQLWSQGVIQRDIKAPCTVTERTNVEVRQKLDDLQYDSNQDFLLDYELLELFKEFTVPVYAIFLTIDLYYQAFPQLAVQPHEERFWQRYLVTCVGMVLKLYGYSDILENEKLLGHATLVKEKIVNKELVETEREIIEHLGGKLVRKSYYDYIRTVGQLQELVEITSFSRDYLAADDFERWAVDHPESGNPISTLTLEDVLGMF